MHRMRQYPELTSGQTRIGAHALSPLSTSCQAQLPCASAHPCTCHSPVTLTITLTFTTCLFGV